MTADRKVYLDTAATPETISAFVASLQLTPPVLIKPNWGTVECFTEAAILDAVLSAISGDRLVIESCGWARSEEVLLKKDSLPGRKENYRQSERWFLQYSGVDQVLAKHGVEYLNLTEEVWAGRTVDPATIQKVVEEKYLPVQMQEMYAQVPTRLYEMRGGTLISLAKYRLVFAPIVITFSMKNLFGLIPGPGRGKFHGKDDVYLDQSIVDIHKIYRSLFSVKGILEGVLSAGDSRNSFIGQIVKHNPKIAFACEDPLTLDAYVSTAAGYDPHQTGHMALAAQNFGAWDAEVCVAAKQNEIKIFE
jgi:uncharacterized protein (DUF362 family)